MRVWQIVFHGTRRSGLLPALLTTLMVSTAAAQQGSITGRVIDEQTGEPLIGANISVVGTNYGTATDDQGRYSIKHLPVGAFDVQARFIGYASAIKSVKVSAAQTQTLDFSLRMSSLPGEDVVVTASRRAEKMTEAPATISVVGARELDRTTGFSYGEALSKAKGIDFYRTGIDGIGINARGFMTAYSYRTQLMADGKNSMLPGAGLAAGTFLPVGRDDIERIEMVLGPSSALYGPNAHNGLVNIITKHPRDYPGTTLTVGGGQNTIMLGRLRHAGMAGEQFAYKLNAEFLRGEDWVKNDTVGVDNTGKFYFEDPDNNVRNFRADLSLYYFLNRDVEVVGSLGYSSTNSIGTTNVGRNQIVGWKYDFQQIRINSPHFFVQFYRTGNNAGRTHAIENKVRAQIAAANAGLRITPDLAIDQVKFIDNSTRYNAEAQFNTSINNFRFILGANYEDSRPVSQGTYLADTTGNKLKIRQGGVYGQVEAKFAERWKFVAAARYDDHDNYEAQFSPRGAVVYSIPGYGSFRFTVNRAFQAPAILQQELYLIFGSLPGTTIPIFLRGNGHGFTMSNGSKIDPLQPETNTTYEFGYKGLVTRDIYLDVNVYRSRYQNFISPLTPITDLANGIVPVKQGDVDIAPFPSQFVFTYRNFGRVNINGFDLGVNVQLSRSIGAWFNYSFVDPVDLEDEENDFNKDGKFEELSFNTPKHKFNAGFGINNLLTRGLYGSLSMRFVDEYDFISGSHRATKAGEGTGRFQFRDRGPLGGFTTFDMNLSYRLQSGVQFNLSITNLLDTPLREFVGSPDTRRLIIGEVKYSF